MMNEITKLPHEDLPESLRTIATRAEARKKRSTRDFIILSIFLSCCFLTTLLLKIYCTNSVYPLGMAAFTGIFEFTFLQYILRRSRRGDYALNEEDLRQLAAINDKRVLNVLFSVPQARTSKKLSSRRESLLKHWLPLLTIEDTDLLDKEQKNRLARILEDSGDDLTKAIFGALEQIGDKNQLPALKRWKLNYFGSRVKPEVKAAYKSCLTAIEKRNTVEVVNSQLLRASSPSDQPQTLLMPTMSKPDDNAETLLRAETGVTRKDEGER